jgi:hypothetical protein
MILFIYNDVIFEGVGIVLELGIRLIFLGNIIIFT